MTFSDTDWPIHFVETATSSSDLVRMAAANGALEGTGFLVGTQTEGRGRLGRHWASQQGGMYYSVLLKPSFPTDRWFGLSFVACLAIRDVIVSYLVDQNVSFKWPNDVIIAGRGKICGILIEVHGDSLIVGTGVNIAPVDWISGSGLPPAAMSDFDETKITPHEMAAAYRTQLSHRYKTFAKNGFASVRYEWLCHCAHRQQPITVNFADKAIRGVFTDLGEDGALKLLADDGRTHHISTGDVELVGQV